MSDAVLNIGAVVDKDAITSGMAEGAAGVKQATTNISVYFQDLQSRASGAWKKISEDTRTAASSINAESLRIAESTKAVTVAQRELSAAMALARNSSVDEAAGMAVLAAAQANVRAKTLELKEAQAAVAEVSHKAVTDVQATSAAVRSFEGNPGIRAMEVFIGRTLGLGPVLQTIFPLIGAAAFASILFGMGEELVDIEQKASHAGEAIREAFEDSHEKAQVVNDDLAIQNDKLQDQIDKLSGHPGTGLQTALDEGRKMADKLLESLQADRKELEALLKEHEVGALGQILSGVSATGSQSAQIVGDQKSLTAAVRAAQADFEAAVSDSKDKDVIKAAADRRNEAVSTAYQSQIALYRAESARLKEEEKQSVVDALAAGEAGGNAPLVDNSAKIANIEGRARQLQDQLRREKLSESIETRGQTVGVLQQGKGDSSAENKAAEQRMRAMEVEYSQLQHLHVITLKEEHDFWEARVDAFAQGSEQYTRIQEKIGQLDQQGAVKAHESLSKLIASEKAGSAADPEAAASVAKAMEDVNRLLREQAEDATRTGERWQSYNASVAKGAEIAAKLQESMAEGRLHILEQEHGITALGAAQAQARIHAEEHTAALKALQDELEALRAAGANLKPGDKGFEQNASQQQNVQNQIQQQAGQGQVQAQADQAGINAAISKPYLTAFTDINNGWLKVQRDLIQGNKNISRDFAQMGLGLVQTMAQNFEKMLVQQLRIETRMVLAHQAANLQKTQSDVAAAQTGNSIHATAALKEVFIDAKTAAAGAWKATVGIPIVGPILAPIAAGASFAGVMALAAFEQGGVVGGGSSYQMGVPILAHAGERVLSYDQTQNFERMVNRSGSGAETHIHNYGGNNFSQAGNDFKSQWAAHERHIVKRLKTLRREGKL